MPKVSEEELAKSLADKMWLILEPHHNRPEGRATLAALGRLLFRLVTIHIPVGRQEFIIDRLAAIVKRRVGNYNAEVAAAEAVPREVQS